MHLWQVSAQKLQSQNRYLLCMMILDEQINYKSLSDLHTDHNLCGSSGAGPDEAAYT